MNKIDEKVLEYKDEMIKSIERLVNIPSIEGASCIDAPFGEFSKKNYLPKIAHFSGRANRRFLYPMDFELL